jgi:hypothetical protein
MMGGGYNFGAPGQGGGIGFVLAMAVTLLGGILLIVWIFAP